MMARLNPKARFFVQQISHGSYPAIADLGSKKGVLYVAFLLLMGISELACIAVG